jgi:hypothetical protein
VKILLRIAAVYSLAWAIALAFPSRMLAVAGVPLPELRALANGLVIANLTFAYLFYRAASDPFAQRTILYGGLLLFGLRGAVGTYEVLFVLDGAPAVARLADMVLSLALFVGLLNSLPGTLLGPRGQRDVT